MTTPNDVTPEAAEQNARRLSRLAVESPEQPVTDEDVVPGAPSQSLLIAPEKVKRMTGRSQPAPPTEEERRWAALAHASIWLTLATSVVTVGFGAPISIFVPLVIYFLFRKKSEYVTTQALQAFVVQALATVGVGLLAVVGSVVWVVGMIIAVLAIFVLAGLILVPVWALVGVVFLIVVLIAPFSALFLGTMAAIETFNGRPYRYPWIGRWIDQQLAGGFLQRI